MGAPAPAAGTPQQAGTPPSLRTRSQTGTGKSHTMDGGPDEQQGIIPRAFVHIFETVEASSDTQWMVRASFLEIYNEEVRAPAHCAVSLRRRSLHSDNGVVDGVQGQAWLPVRAFMSKQCPSKQPSLPTSIAQSTYDT